MANSTEKRLKQMTEPQLRQELAAALDDARRPELLNEAGESSRLWTYAGKVAAELERRKVEA